MTLFQRATGLLSRSLRQAAGVSVVYSRGALSVTVVAVQGQTRFVSNLDGGPRVEWGDRDYLIDVADLAAVGEPQIGDRITERLAGEERVFEVLTPGTGEPAWRWSDPAHTRYRIHTMRVQ